MVGKCELIRELESRATTVASGRYPLAKNGSATKYRCRAKSAPYGIGAYRNDPFADVARSFDRATCMRKQEI